MDKFYAWLFFLNGINVGVALSLFGYVILHSYGVC